MFIPRNLFSSAYAHLKAHAHSTNPSILILCALDTDSLCAARILTHLLKRDYIPHKIHPVAGYQELEKVNNTLIKGNEELRFVICLGLGGLVDLSSFLELTGEDGRNVECWVVDGRRPWNLYNVYTGPAGYDGVQVVEDAKVKGGRYSVGEEVGGIKCFDDGDIEEDMKGEGAAFKALIEMPEVDSEDESDSEDEDDDGAHSSDGDEVGGVILDSGLLAVTNGRKRKSSDEPEGDESDEENGRGSSRVRRRRRGSNEVCLLPRICSSTSSNLLSSLPAPPPHLSIAIPSSQTPHHVQWPLLHHQHVPTPLPPHPHNHFPRLHLPATPQQPRPYAASSAVSAPNTNPKSQSTTPKVPGTANPSPASSTPSPPISAAKTTISSGSPSSASPPARSTAAGSLRGHRRKAQVSAGSAAGRSRSAPCYGMRSDGSIPRRSHPRVRFLGAPTALIIRFRPRRGHRRTRRSG